MTSGMPEDRGQDLCGTSVLHHPMTIFILGRCRARVIWSGISRSMPHAVIQLSAFLLRCRPYRCNGLLIAKPPGRSEFGTVVPSARNRQKLRGARYSVAPKPKMAGPRASWKPAARRAAPLHERVGVSRSPVVCGVQVRLSWCWYERE